MKVEKYAIIFGKNPELGLYELKAFLKRFKLGVRILEIRFYGPNKSFAIIQAKEEIEKKFKWLGGALKLVRIVGEGLDTIENLEYSKLFTVSLYGKEDWKAWRKLGSQVKAVFKRKDSSKFFKPANVYSMPSELILKGFPEVKDVVFLFVDKDRVLVGETIRITNPFELKKLDVERPIVRPTLSIPPRLARIMINLSEVRKGNVLDPFCGTGTILVELLLQGLIAYGSDISQERINDARKNIEWIRKEFRIKQNASLRVCDVRRLKKCFRTRFDAIITEPYMGRPLKTKPTREEAIKIAKQLDRLYYQAFESFSDVLKRNAKVVFVFPAFNLAEGGVYRRNRPWLEELGFKVEYSILDIDEKHRIGRDIYVIRY